MKGVDVETTGNVPANIRTNKTILSVDEPNKNILTGMNTSSHASEVPGKKIIIP